MIAASKLLRTNALLGKVSEHRIFLLADPINPTKNVFLTNSSIPATHNTSSNGGILNLTLSCVLPKSPFTLQKRSIYSSSTTSSSINNEDHYETPDFSSHLRPQEPATTSSSTTNRPFTYFVVGATGVLGAMSAKSTVMNFLSSLSASGDVLAMAQVEVDLTNIPQGKSVVIKWRGKPVFIRHRTPGEVEEAQALDISQLRDPQSDADRTRKPQWIVMMGICTHLGCVPLADAGDYNGWYCPCHGSHYDISGRIRKGPAPLNLEIPKYKFIDDDHIVIG